MFCTTSWIREKCNKRHVLYFRLKERRKKLQKPWSTQSDNVLPYCVEMWCWSPGWHLVTMRTQVTCYQWWINSFNRIIGHKCGILKSQYNIIYIIYINLYLKGVFGCNFSWILLGNDSFVFFITLLCCFLAYEIVFLEYIVFKEIQL